MGDGNGTRGKSGTRKYFKAKFLHLWTTDPFGDTRIYFRVFEPSHLNFMYISMGSKFYRFH